MRARRWREALAALALNGAMAAPSASANEHLRYLALGDSYTIGEGVAPEGRWTHQLAAALRADGIPLADPTTIARTGWTTDELDAAIDAAGPAADYDFVSLAIGVNNQYRGRDVVEYRREFEALLRRATGFASGRPGRVLVLSIPDWGATVFGRASGRDRGQVAREIDAFNAAARAVCERHGVAFVDITSESRTPESRTPASREHAMTSAMLADDGLHPSAAMYARWTALARPVAARLLDAARGAET
jgi:lysophospholipase L1-like esterase